MAHPGVDHLRPAGRRAVSLAVAVRAEERPALDHPARHPELRLARVVAALDLRAARVAGDAARCRVRRRIVARGIPVARPLPDVPGHVEETVGGSPGTSRPPRYARSPVPRATGSRRASSWPAAPPPARAPPPRRRRRAPGLRVRRPPTPPRSAGPGRPMTRTPWRSRRRRGPPGAGPVRRGRIRPAGVPPRCPGCPGPPEVDVPEVHRPRRAGEDRRAGLEG